MSSKYGAIQNNASITATYYPSDKVASLTYPDGETVNYGYDTMGNILTAGFYVAYAGYNALGQPGTATYGNAVVTNYVYDPETYQLSNLTTSLVAPGDLLSLDYTYFPNGAVKSISDNRTLPVFPMTDIGFTLDAGTAHRLATSTISSLPFGYDYNGNMTFDGMSTIGYDINNMPTSVGTSAFKYDGNGKRVKKTSTLGTITYFDKFYECGNGACSKYIFAGATRIATKGSTGTFYYHPDHLGSTSAVTDQGKNSVENIAYYPFGETRADTGYSARHKYTGQDFDSETGLYNYDARLYSPALGRFVSPDTIVQDPTNPQSFNRYSYVQNNPVNMIDPTGHEASFTITTGGGGSNSGGSGGPNGQEDGNRDLGQDLTDLGKDIERIGRDIGDAAERVGREIKRFFGGHKHHSSPPPPPKPSATLHLQNYAASQASSNFPSLYTIIPFSLSAGDQVATIATMATTKNPGLALVGISCDGISMVSGAAPKDAANLGRSIGLAASAIGTYASYASAAGVMSISTVPSMALSAAGLGYTIGDIINNTKPRGLDTTIQQNITDFYFK